MIQRGSTNIEEHGSQFGAPVWGEYGGQFGAPVTK
jgi:hypothetical protein